VFIIDEDHVEKDGQRYVEPLVTMTGREYEAASFDELLRRITDALEARFGAAAQRISVSRRGATAPDDVRKTFFPCRGGIDDQAPAWLKHLACALDPAGQVSRSFRRDDAPLTMRHDPFDQRLPAIDFRPVHCPCSLQGALSGRCWPA
jgi:hypothetical protein